MGFEILLYVPNLIGYGRLVLLFWSWLYFHSHPVAFLVLYIISTVLDAFDGYAARKLNQCSAFGAWFDVVIDVLGRGMLWCRIYEGFVQVHVKFLQTRGHLGVFGYLVVVVEWLTFVCTHTQGAEWKQAYVNTPVLIQKVCVNNFRNPLGIVVIGSLYTLPIWLYAHYHGVLDTYLYLPRVVQYVGIGLLSAGRALCMAIELWCVWCHIQFLCSDEANKPKHTASKKNSSSGESNG